MTATEQQTGLVRRGHQYTLDGVRVPSVTSVLNDGVPKPLTKWAAEAVAKAAVNRWDELAALDPMERFDQLKVAAVTERDSKANRGTILHGVHAALSKGEAIEVPAEYAQLAQLMVKLADRLRLAPLVVERPVLSRKYQYAGTPDLFATITQKGRAELWLLDLKTGRGVYDSHALQLAGYRYADAWVDEDGTEHEMPTFDHAGVIHLTPDAVRLIEVDATQRAYQTFLHALHVAHWTRACRTAWTAHDPWPVGESVMTVLP